MWDADRASATNGRGRRSPVTTVLLGLYFLGSLFFAYLFYASVRDIVANGRFPFQVGKSSVNSSNTNPSDPGPISTGHQLTERVNILLLGIDRRDNDPGPWRTDTMMIVSIDPISKTATLLSIPRDLWVPIPDYGLGVTEDRINAAHAYGDAYKYPGGGPALAKKTVQYNLGIPIHYYVRVDFRGFEKIIDTIGGIDVDVPKDIVDNEYPTSDYGTERLYIPAGRQHMNGTLALKYARTRHADNDFQRARRQQQVILAVRDKVLSLNIPLSRIPQLVSTLGESVQTDMTLDEIMVIAQATRDVKEVKQGLIDETMTVSWTTPGGAMVQVPQRDKIRELVTQLFPVPTPAVSLGPLGDTDKLGAEAARVEVQNGSQTAGLATKVAGELRAAGYNVVRYNNADRQDYPDTLIISYTDKRYTVESLKQELQIPDERVLRQNPPAGSDADIRVILGAK
jgi:polyisoprenyl-teichoic acid--peptidoglycan teichoic acid transferase